MHLYRYFYLLLLLLCASLPCFHPGIAKIRLSAAYQGAMRNQGKARFPVIRIMLCGEGRVGKSSLLDVLIGNLFKALDSSTRCLELKTSSCAVDSSGSWKELCDKETIEHAQEILLRNQPFPADQAKPCQLSDGDHQ